MLNIASFESLLEGCSSTSKSSSEDTIRPKSVCAAHRTNIERNSPKVVARQESPGGSQMRAIGRSSNGGERNRESRSPSSAEATTGRAATSSSSSDQEPWRIHYSRPPLSIAISCGPMSWADLAKRLSFDDETVSSFVCCCSRLRQLIQRYLLR
jgi:hypothetical protein